MLCPGPRVHASTCALYTCECDSPTVCHNNRWSSADCPWAIPSQDEPPNGARAGGQATVRGCRPLLLPLLPLGALSAKNKLSENHIFSGLKVKNATFPPSGKRSACQLWAYLLRSFLPLGEAGEAGKGGGERLRKAEEGSPKERPVTVDLGQLGVWKPVGLFVLEQLKSRMGLIRK